MMNKLIKTEEDYSLVLSRIEDLMDAETNTPEAEELELLATLIELYEDEHYAMDTPEPIEACVRENSGNRTNAKTDSYALNSWCMRIMAIAQTNTLQRKFDHANFTSDSLKEIAKLSFFDEGPLLAQEFLEKHGIHLIIERHLPKTYLDGAALLLEDSTPVVGLTLR